MQNFRPNITRIKGLSDRRRMPLLGKIRLGIKVKNQEGAEYPRETDYFVCPDEVKEIFNEQPKSLEIMLPLNDIDAVFPTAYILYGHSIGVKCKGDGERAWHVDPESKEMIDKECPCEMLDAGKCKQVGRFLFMIPKVSVAGVYQLSTSSYNSIVDIGSGLDFVQAMVGRFAFISLEMKRIPTITHHNGKRQTHHTIQIKLPDAFNLKALEDMKADNNRIFTQARYQLPAPLDENPELDPPDIIDITDEEEPPTPEEEPTTEPEDVNWWDLTTEKDGKVSYPHWSFRKGSGFDTLVRYGLGAPIPSEADSDKLIADNPEAKGSLKTALPATKNAVMAKYIKLFDAGKWDMLMEDLKGPGVVSEINDLIAKLDNYELVDGYLKVFGVDTVDEIPETEIENFKQDLEIEVRKMEKLE